MYSTAQCLFSLVLFHSVPLFLAGQSESREIGCPNARITGFDPSILPSILKARYCNYYFLIQKKEGVKKGTIGIRGVGVRAEPD